MKRFLVTGVALAALALAGCNSYNEQRGKGDAPVGQTDDSPATIINFPNNFANVAHKCYGTTGLYSNTRNAGDVTVVPSDPRCAPGG